MAPRYAHASPRVSQRQPRRSRQDPGEQRVDYDRHDRIPLKYDPTFVPVVPILMRGDPATGSLQLRSARSLTERE
jgi:hypothetical protein